MVEDHVYVLDYLPRGRPDDPRRKDPVAYGIGERNFVLLELVPKVAAAGGAPANMLVGDRVYVGKDPEPAGTSPIDHVRGRVRPEELTHAAQSEMPFVIEQIVKAQEERFLRFYNEAGPITTRMHMLELLPGLGKKLMWAIVEERKKKPFTSFKEMDERVKALHAPEKLIVQRIATEVTDPNQKYHLFAQPPAPPEEERFRRHAQRSREGYDRGPPRGGHGP